MQKPKIYICHTLSLLIVVCLVFLASSCTHEKPIPIVKATNLGFEDVDASHVYAKFYLLNKNNVSAECSVELSIKAGSESRNETYYVGTIPPFAKEEKKILIKMPFGKTEVTITPICLWVEEPVQEISDCEPYQNVRERRACELAVKYGLSSCLKADIEYKFFCIAFLSGDINICDLISNYKREHCYAYLSMNESFCEKIGKQIEKDWCYQDLALNWNNRELCEKIIDSDKKTFCLAVLEEKSELCKQIAGEPDKVDCITRIAMKTGMLNLCNQLQKSELVEQCMNAEGEWVMG